MHPSRTDPQLAKLTALADTYHQQKAAADSTRAEVDAMIHQLKAQDYSYSQLSRAAGLSIATVQNILGVGQTAIKRARREQNRR